MRFKILYISLVLVLCSVYNCHSMHSMHTGHTGKNQQLAAAPATGMLRQPNNFGASHTPFVFGSTNSFLRKPSGLEQFQLKPLPSSLTKTSTQEPLKPTADKSSHKKHRKKSSTKTSSTSSSKPDPLLSENKLDSKKLNAHVRTIVETNKQDLVDDETLQEMLAKFSERKDQKRARRCALLGYEKGVFAGASAIGLQIVSELNEKMRCIGAIEGQVKQLHDTNELLLKDTFTVHENTGIINGMLVTFIEETRNTQELAYEQQQTHTQNIMELKAENAQQAEQINNLSKQVDELKACKLDALCCIKFLDREILGIYGQKNWSSVAYTFIAGAGSYASSQFLDYIITKLPIDHFPLNYIAPQVTSLAFMQRGVTIALVSLGALTLTKKIFDSRDALWNKVVNNKKTIAASALGLGAATAVYWSFKKGFFPPVTLSKMDFKWLVKGGGPITSGNWLFFGKNTAHLGASSLAVE